MFVVSHDISMGITSDFTDLPNVEALKPSKYWEMFAWIIPLTVVLYDSMVKYEWREIQDLTLFGILVYWQNKTKQTNKQNKQKINKHLILTRLDTVQFLSNIYH
jgi:hypothetical protein